MSEDPEGVIPDRAHHYETRVPPSRCTEQEEEWGMQLSRKIENP